MFHGQSHVFNSLVFEETEVLLSFAWKIRLFTLFFLLFPHVRIWAEDPIDDLLEATFRIADKEHSGTCFLVSPKSVDAANPRRVILATAAHVLEQMSGDDCEIFLRRKEDDGHYSRQPLTIAIRNLGKPLWTRHPDVDLSSLFLDLPEGVLFNPIPFEMVADEVRVIDRTIRAGKETWIPCYPAKLEANDAGWPVLRHGSIASHPLVPVKSVRTMLVDYKNFGGDSGAPVVMIVNNRPLVIGIVSGMHRQTDRSNLPFEERTMHTPMGLSIVTQAAYLRETIEIMSR